MKLQGSHILPASPDRVWELLNDPKRLATLLPGCESLEPAGKDKYKAKVKFGLAAFTGDYAGSLEIADKKPLKSMRLKIEGKGVPGFMTADGHIELKAFGKDTELKYEGEAQVGGLIASVGQRMIEGAAKKIVGEFFDRASKLLSKK
ncbi:MAG: carbon monoxide dehydrogenase subunit G [Acidobacteria bacterium]|nr:carbon monoxide dehydrogenase subunit G [Acidobacteriota bacterium]